LHQNRYATNEVLQFRFYEDPLIQQEILPSIGQDLIPLLLPNGVRPLMHLGLSVGKVVHLEARLLQWLGLSLIHASNPNSKMLEGSNGYEALIEVIVLHPELETGRGSQNQQGEYHPLFCHQELAEHTVHTFSDRDTRLMLLYFDRP
jgi:hypothetical protein